MYSIYMVASIHFYLEASRAAILQELTKCLHERRKRIKINFGPMHRTVLHFC